MRKMYMIFPARSTEQRQSTKTRAVANQLEEQRAINAELIRVCERQRLLLAEQSGMIEEILEGMGR